MVWRVLQWENDSNMKEELVVVGAGAHAKVVVDIIRQNEKYELAGLVDDLDKEGFGGLKIIGDDNCLNSLWQKGIRKIFIAVGNNQVRKRLFETVQNIGFEIINVISEHAIISPYVKMGKGNVVMPGAVINVDTVIGDGCIINTNCSIDHDGHIGDFVHVAPGAAIAGSVAIGGGTFCGVGCRIIDGVKVGKNVVVGAGTVIISNIESDCTIVGVPARYTKKG